MSDKLALDFPVLQQDGVDFVEAVSYEVAAEKTAEKLTITHTLKGQSFIRDLVKEDVARFSVLLLYKNSDERQSHVCADSIDIKDSEIIARQTIPIMDFSYAPEIRPSIILSKGKKITVEESSGLSDFWEQVESFDIPQYSRIALFEKLKFTSGDISKLMKVELDNTLGDGEMRVEVNEDAGEGETPVSLLCGKGVYDALDALRNVIHAEPRNATESMRRAIITQALCATYAYMHMHKPGENGQDEVSGVLAAHLEQLESQTGANWENDDFNPSLAATKMYPYILKAFDGEADDA